MKIFNIQFVWLLCLTFVYNMATAQETDKSTDEKIIMVKKTTDKNGKKRVETITEKNGETIVKVTIDGEEVPTETMTGDELVVLNKDGKTFFLREIDENIVQNLDLAFEALEVKLNNINMSDFRLGVAEDSETNDDEGNLGVEVKESRTGESDIKHVKITAVSEESAAEEAGLKKGDIISAIDGKQVRSLSQFMHLIKANAPGETITIDYIRDGESFQTKATLKAGKTSNSILFGGGDTRIEWDDDGKITWKGDEDFTIKLPMMSNKGEMGVTLGESSNEGVAISHVEKKSGAAQAGLKAGDVITEIDGNTIMTSEELIELLEDKKAGETVDVGYTRNGSVYKTPVILKKSNNIFFFKNDEHEIKWENNDDDWDFNWIEDDGNASMGILLGDDLEEGILVDGTIENSGAEAAGLKKGDIITAINGEKVNTNEALIEAIQTQNAGDEVQVTYLRDGEENTVDVELGTKKVMIKKPRDIDVLFKDKEEDEEMEEYKKVETPTVSEGQRLEFTQLDMYPNPNQGAFSLDFEIPAGATTITIVDVDGKEVFKKEMPDFNGIFSDRIDISEQPSGVYFLNIIQGEKRVVKKVIYN